VANEESKKRLAFLETGVNVGVKVAKKSLKLLRVRINLVGGLKKGKNRLVVKGRTPVGEAKCSGIPAQAVERGSGWGSINVGQTEQGCDMLRVGSVKDVMRAQRCARLAKDIADDLGSFTFLLQAVGNPLFPTLSAHVLGDLRMTRTAGVEADFVGCQAVDNILSAAFLQHQCPISNDHEVGPQPLLSEDRRKLLNAVVVSQFWRTEDVFNV
jgi:uncharacterized protein (UPF0210 family)